MSNSPLGRVVDITSAGRYLCKERGFLTVREGDLVHGRIPLDDLAALVISASGATVSTPLIAELADRGIPTVFCASNHHPVGIVWPLAAHHRQQRRLQQQAEATRPLKKQLWAQLVRGKIQSQAWLVAQLGEDSQKIGNLIKRVRSGDPDNLEARAARLYWKQVFGPGFRRDRKQPGTNALLNYGYTILRAAVARAIAGTGLHPGLGIFHRHPQNTSALADDLIEPFRAAVDWRVCRLEQRGLIEVTPESKRVLAGTLASVVQTRAGNSPLGTAILRTTQSLARSFETGKPGLELPTLVSEVD